MGTMGSGKTTVARLLAKELNLHLLEENFGENAFLPRFYQDMKRWAFHSQTFFLMEKVTQLLQARVILEGAKRPIGSPADAIASLQHDSSKGIVQDTPIQQDAFSNAKAQHVLGNIDDTEWRLYLKIYHSFEPYFPKPNLIIYLETTVPALADRIEKRGRGYEQKIPASYLELLDMLNHKWLAENKTIPVLTIETDGLNVVRSKKSQEKLVSLVKEKCKL